MKTAGSPYEPEIEVSLDNIAHNLAQVRARAPGAEVIAVVKDDAYGVGAVPVSRALERRGAAMLAVARGLEARRLREGGVSSPILVLGECSDSDLRWGALHGIRFALNDLATVERWAALDVPLIFHIKIDTGMGRLGLLPGEADALLDMLTRTPLMRAEGLFTHFACADVPGTSTVARQMEIFDGVRRRLGDGGLHCECVHVSNSAAAARFGAMGCTHVRPGIELYGCNPDPSQDFGFELAPAVTLSAPVVKVKRVPAGTALSYCGAYRTAAETLVATIGVGYAHGVPRALSGKGSVLLGGRPYPIAGRVTMDYVLADVGLDAEVKKGDTAVILGCQDGSCITVDQVARACGTIGYEILCNLSTAVARRYILDGAVLAAGGGEQ